MHFLTTLTAHFPDAIQLHNSTYKFEIELATGVITYYCKIENDGIKKLIVCENGLDESIAIQILNHSVKLNGERMLITPVKIDAINFDAIIFTQGLVHKQLRGIFDEQRENIYLCLPMYKGEFWGDETEKEFLETCFRLTSAYDWGRKRSPKSLVAFKNPKTGGGTIKKGAIMSFATLARSIDEMVGVEGAWMWIQNYKHEKLEFTTSQDKFNLGNEKLSATEFKALAWKFISE